MAWVVERPMRFMTGVKALVVYGHGSLGAEIMAWLVERPGVFMAGVIDGV